MQRPGAGQFVSVAHGASVFVHLRPGWLRVHVSTHGPTGPQAVSVEHGIGIA
jgi:hypothetical protein